MTNTSAIESAPNFTQTANTQSNVSQLDHISTDPKELPRASADALNHALSFADLDEVRAHHLALAMAVIELAHDAGSPFPWSHDDPTIALLRAAAKMSLTHPEATSSAAADLVRRLTDSTHHAA